MILAHHFVASRWKDRAELCRLCPALHSKESYRIMPFMLGCSVSWEANSARCGVVALVGHHCVSSYCRKLFELGCTLAGGCVLRCFGSSLFGLCPYVNSRLHNHVLRFLLWSHKEACFLFEQLWAWLKWVKSAARALFCVAFLPLSAWFIKISNKGTPLSSLSPCPLQQTSPSVPIYPASVLVLWEADAGLF